MHTVLLVACRLERDCNRLHEGEAEAGDAGISGSGVVPADNILGAADFTPFGGAVPKVSPQESWGYLLQFIQRSWRARAQKQPTMDVITLALGVGVTTHTMLLPRGKA